MQGAKSRSFRGAGVGCCGEFRVREVGKDMGNVAFNWMIRWELGGGFKRAGRSILRKTGVVIEGVCVLVTSPPELLAGKSWCIICKAELVGAL